LDIGLDRSGFAKEGMLMGLEIEFRFFRFLFVVLESGVELVGLLRERRGEGGVVEGGEESGDMVGEGSKAWLVDRGLFEDFLKRLDLFDLEIRGRRIEWVGM
jgi:hypothetical protein